MSTLLNRPNNTQSPDPATLHNSQIHERYKKLQNLENAEANQFAQMDAERQTQANAQPRASVLTPERTDGNRVAQTPSVTEYERREEDYRLFTPETLDRTLGRSAAMEAPVQNVTEMPTQYVQESPVVYAAQTEAVAEVEEFGLTRRGKLAIGAFCGFVCALLCVIGVNSNIIAQKDAKLRELEATRQELLVESAEIQARINQATSEETVNQYAIENGWIKADN